MSEDKSIEELLVEHDLLIADKKSVSLSLKILLLKKLRKSKIHRADIVLKYGEVVASKVSNEDSYSVYEQLVLANVEANDLSQAKKFLSILQKKFTVSVRVGRLEGILLEAENKLKEAEELYAKLLNTSPGNISILKRLAGLKKLQKDTTGEIEAINTILSIYPSDKESWIDLSQIYLANCDYTAAIHCFEELVLLDPFTFLYHYQLADAYYSRGVEEDFLMARKHYTISLTHQAPENNLRAFYGLIAACQKCKQVKLSDEHESAVNEALLKWSTEVMATLSLNHSSCPLLPHISKSLF